MGVCTNSHTDPRILTAEPNSETQSPVLCSLVREQDRHKCCCRVIPGDISEQRSLRAVVSSLLYAQIPISHSHSHPISRSLLFQLPPVV